MTTDRILNIICSQRGVAICARPVTITRAEKQLFLLILIKLQIVNFKPLLTAASPIVYFIISVTTTLPSFRKQARKCSIYSIFIYFYSPLRDPNTYFELPSNFYLLNS